MKAHIKLGRVFGIEAKDGRIEGFITRGGVMRLLQARAALEM